MNQIDSSLSERVQKIVRKTAAHDIHTHLYDPAFGNLLLWGIDDLLVYHYLVAEGFRQFDLPYDRFWNLSKAAQAELIWNHLFLKSSPISEACRGVLTILHAHGIDPRKRDLTALRKWFENWKPQDYVTRCMELGGVETICMTNSPFDDQERPLWEKGFQRDDRFQAGLRIDPLLLSWKETAHKLSSWGYRVSEDLSAQTSSEVSRFLEDWTGRISPRYLMVSLPPEFDFPDGSACSKLLMESVLPHCRESGLPLALMPGVRRAVNPQLRLAGDGVGWSRMQAVTRLCADFPANKFLMTLLPRENQHEACVLGRKFRNLHLFGCWWFTNIPVLVEEITRMRLELIGLSFTAQHSDARVLDQIIYKWEHFRKILARILVEKYQALAAVGWMVTETELERDISDLLGGSFEKFCAVSLTP